MTHQPPSTASTPTPPPLLTGRLTLGRRLGYGVGDFAFVALWQGCALFLLYFYTDVLGLPPLLAGAIYLIGMAWDAVSDPLIASWAERRARQDGGYAHLIGLSALPAGLSFTLVFTQPFDGTALVALWALVTHLAFRTAFTCASMPYNALPARLTPNGHERSALSATRVVFAGLGGLMVAVTIPAIAAASGHAIAALAIGLVAGLVLLLCARLMRIAPPLPPTSGPSTLTADLRGLGSATRQNRPFQALLVLMLLGTLGYGMFTQSLLYLANHVLQQPDLVPLILATPVLTMIVAAPAWMMLAARTSKRLTMMCGLGLAALGYAALGLAPTTPPGAALIAIAVIGTGSAAVPVMFWSMLPDVIDHGHARSGTRVEARAFGLATFVQKVTAGLTALFVGGLLALSGYAPDAVTGEALVTIRLMASWLPAVFTLAMIAVIRGYPIDQASHASNLKTIAANAETASATRTGG
ncbi:hypothetical protein AWH62_13260 [Maricaulis sp. W15]|uniref:MFS transporter n=1 Tax=Maricaulis sp. W15 TaxID=1772333 RepID=UPI000948A2EF|nr:MFS transporter [Maricaulis sp. W15]OLF71029.1 hypothetical protein AWH62_13260 [Maricaulis sp. W15]